MLQAVCKQTLMRLFYVERDLRQRAAILIPKRIQRLKHSCTKKSLSLE